MGKLTDQLEETTYSFSVDVDDEVRFIAAEDDELRTTVKPQICVAASEYCGSSCLYSDFTVRSNHPNLSPGQWEERACWFSPHIRHMKKVGGQEIDGHHDTIDDLS
jgi:hypothetical protein